MPFWLPGELIWFAAGLCMVGSSENRDLYVVCLFPLLAMVWEVYL